MSDVCRWAFCAWIVGAVAPSFVQADLIINPGQPITHQVTVHLVQVYDDAGANPATAFGNVAQRAAIEGFVDDIWGQAGIDVQFLPGVTPWNSTSAQMGTGASPRPEADLATIVGDAQTAGIIHADPAVLNLFFVEQVPFFSPLPENNTAGAAFIGANGLTMFVGDDLLLTTPGLEAIAAVAAHEIGHNLGLTHPIPDLPENLMNEESDAHRLDPSQIDTAIASRFALPFSSAPPPPSSIIQETPEPSSGVLMLFAAAMVCYWKRWRLGVVN